MTEEQVVMNIAALVREWQEEGRNGHCLPVLRNELLQELEVFTDKFTRDRCSWCHSSGVFDNGDTCPHCKPLANA